jgi:HEAT repeats
MDAKVEPAQVRRAVEALKRATSALINLLKSPDEAVRAGAAAALKGLDPPPTWALGEALLGSRDTTFRLRIIKVLVALAAVDMIRVVYILCEAFKERRDAEVKRAAATALLVLATERLGQGPAPVEQPASHADLEAESRVRDESSSERVRRRPSGSAGTDYGKTTTA